MKTSITILGSCVSNLIVKYQARIQQNNYLIKGTVEGISQFALATPPVPEMQGVEILYDADYELAKKSLKFGIEKNFDTFARGKYILVDLLSCSRKFFELKKNGITYIIGSYEEYRSRNPKSIEMIERIADENGYELRIVDPLNGDYTDKEIEALITKFALKLVEKYDPRNIIINVVYPVVDELTKSRSINIERYPKGDSLRRCRYMCKIYKYFFKVIPAACAVYMPRNVFADPWGMSNGIADLYHYHILFYEHELEAINVITDNEEYVITNKRLKELNEAYSNKLFEAKLKAMTKTCYEWKKTAYDIQKFNTAIKYKGTYLEFIKEYYKLENKDVGNYVIDANTLIDYVNKIMTKKCSYVIMMSVCGTANKYWNKFINKNDLGIKVDLAKDWHKSYCAIVELSNGNVIEKFNNSADELILDYQLYMYNNASVYENGNVISNFPYCVNIMLVSKARENGISKSRILINNIDYSIDMPGMNFVIYCVEKQCVIDSFNVDFYGDADLKINREKTR